MDSQSLEHVRVAILATDGVEQIELLEPKKALDEAGAQTHVVAPVEKTIKGWDIDNWGQLIPVDVQLEEANPEDYDALMLPGGVMNPDKLRMNPQAVAFVKAFVSAHKPIAAICHGPWTLLEAGGVRGHILTSWPSLKTDMLNGGATWIDQEVVTDDGLVTSRKPDDLPIFCRKMIEEFAGSRVGVGTRGARAKAGR